MFDLTLTDVSMLKDGLVFLRQLYTNPDWVALIGQEAADEMLAKVATTMTKLTSFGYSTDVSSIEKDAVTGVVYTIKEHKLLVTGTRKKHNILCQCGTQFYTALTKAICPNCEAWHEIWEKPDGN